MLQSIESRHTKPYKENCQSNHRTTTSAYKAKYLKAFSKGRRHKIEDKNMDVVDLTE